MENRIVNKINELNIINYEKVEELEVDEET